MDTQDINTCRAEIDRLDKEILRLLNARAESVLTIGRLKKESGRAVRDPQREQRVLDQLCAANSGPLTAESISEIWNTIFAVSRNMEHKVES